MRSGHILGEELHFLRHAALDDGVVFVESYGKRLAIQDLLADLVFYHGVELFDGWLAVPLRDEVQIHLPQFVKAHNDLLWGLDAHASPMQISIDGKEGSANDQRLAQPALERLRNRQRVQLGLGS